MEANIPANGSKEETSIMVVVDAMCKPHLCLAQIDDGAPEVLKLQDVACHSEI